MKAIKNNWSNPLLVLRELFSNKTLLSKKNSTEQNNFSQAKKRMHSRNYNIISNAQHTLGL
ncbi:MAG: hypothetical protein J0M08_01915 [Bacteroidetes bacterium]|nr:hypothetical protein [Bacteroidota bacterium]